MNKSRKAKIQNELQLPSREANQEEKILQIQKKKEEGRHKNSVGNVVRLFFSELYKAKPANSG